MAKKKVSKSPRKIAVCVTFPNAQFRICAAEMLGSFRAYWPEDIKLYVQLDEQPEPQFKELNNDIIDIVGEGRSFIAGLFDDEQKAFIQRWKDHKPKSYMDDVVKWSHKVFALEKCADAIKDDIDVLIWMDADVITKRPIDREWLETVLPAENEVCSYLGRDTLYPECGFVAYNLKAGGYELLKAMHDVYTGDKFTAYKEGVTDCHVFIEELKKSGKPAKNLSPNFVYKRDDLHVWAQAVLAERLAHRKGMRKVDAAPKVETVEKPRKQPEGSRVVDADQMNIKTRNCLDHEKICGNIRANKANIRAWVTLCRPSEKMEDSGILWMGSNGINSLKNATQNEIVICSAGPSLADHIDEIRALQASGAKVIAVKHAIEALKAHKITPWAVVLLDPRGHVEGFVKTPDPEPYYFVASMCDPSVVNTLNQHKCKVIGYHALVNAGEINELIAADLPIGGGSGTSTRSIALFADMFGYKTFHLFGYDLCHHQKPDMNEKSEDGQPKYMELNLGTYTHKNKYVTRTFWTEGQFLAQSNELKSLYKERKDLAITVYGNGIAGWLFKHYNLHQRYLNEYKDNLNRKREGTPTLDEYLAAATRGTDFSRSSV